MRVIWIHFIPSLLCQDGKGQLIGLAVEVFEQGRFEEGVVGSSSQKQGHAGAEFQIIWGREDLFSAVTIHAEDKLRTFSESLTQDGVLQVGLGLIKRSDGELLCHSAVAETLDLRKDEPDPVTGLSPCP